MKLMGKDAYDIHKTLSDYQFSAVGMDDLEGSEYTIVQLLVDASGSVASYKKELESVVQRVAESCKKSPRSGNLLLRVAAFGSHFKGNISEWHGFTLLDSIDTGKYKGALNPNGATPLFDAALSSLESLDVFGRSLADQDYLVNGILFVITDGCENASRCRTATKIKKTVKRIRQQEKLESIQTILIGVDDRHIQKHLRDFRDKAGFDEYTSLGDAKPEKLAKLAQFVSHSISATSQALGSGAPSGQIGFVI